MGKRMELHGGRNDDRKMQLQKETKLKEQAIKIMINRLLEKKQAIKRYDKYILILIDEMME